MIRRILVLGGISMAIGLAQAPATNAAPKPVAAAKAKGAYVPLKTPWGEPDLQGIWPINHLIAVPLVRPKALGEKFLLDDAEFAKQQDAIKARNARLRGPIPAADAPDRAMRQTSLIVDPKNGQFPELTALGMKLQADMRSSYRPGQTVFDNVDDFAAWDRCVTRGMPVSMEPRNYNNGIRIVQSPGYVAVITEMAHETRIIPTKPLPKLDKAIETWLGEPRGHWEGNTLVVESTNFNGLVGHTSAGVPGSPGPVQPETKNQRIVERFTRVGPEEIEYKMTIEDPSVLATPNGSYTIQYPMYLDNKYEMYEYACHEGNTAVRNYIETSRYERLHPAPPSAAPAKPAKPTPPAK